LQAEQTASELKELASDVLAKALKAGATDAEAVVYEGDEFSALVRLGQVETLKESGSRAIGLRVFAGSGRRAPLRRTSRRSRSNGWSMARSRWRRSPAKIRLPGFLRQMNLEKLRRPAPLLRGC
jgi:Predicted Zn-dependent proteases and their inactivated homologs